MRVSKIIAFIFCWPHKFDGSINMCGALARQHNREPCKKGRLCIVRSGGNVTAL